MLIEDVSTTAAGDDATVGAGTNAGAGTSVGRKISADDAANAMFKVNLTGWVQERLNKKEQSCVGPTRMVELKIIDPNPQVLLDLADGAE
jgi:hypothetical protein